jgi:hypothetical protein
MNDRELLDLAAKAIGQKIVGIAQAGFSDSAKIIGVFLDDGKDSWNPLEDDGDALRLAVQMHFAIEVGVMSTSVDGLLDRDKGIAIELHGEDPRAATRRAIVRAAAEIGKAMP